MQRLINTGIAVEHPWQRAAQLKTDFDELEELLQKYLGTIVQIPAIAESYNVLKRRIGILQGNYNQ
jgi:hypothetical protein